MCLAIAAGCAKPPTTIEWARVRVDPISVSDSKVLEADLTQCALLADNARMVARQQDSAEAGKAAVGGAIAGAAIGAALGSMYGEAGKGAAWGSAAGVGHANPPKTEETVRQDAIGGCLRNRGYALLW